MKGKERLVWIIAGESSGDLYGARLACELRKLSKEPLKIAGMGSDGMRKAGVEIMVDSSELGIVGLIEVLKHIRTFIGIFLLLKRRAISERPDAVILIDYPGFNLRFAEQMFSRKIPVIWFICPQVWVWGKGRIPKLAKFCRKMLVIFPFEKEVFSGTSLDTEFVGHPLIDIMREEAQTMPSRKRDQFLLLPGSRRDEIKRLFPSMLETVRRLRKEKPYLSFVVAAPRESISRMISAMLKDFISQNNAEELNDVEIVCGDTHRLLYESGTGLAASGTVTVEAAIAGLPLVVIYRVNPLTYFLGSLIIKKLFRNFITMVNIIACKEVYKEYLQHFTIDELKSEIVKILPDGSRRKEIESEIAETVSKLSSGGIGACKRAAISVLNCIAQKI